MGREQGPGSDCTWTHRLLGLLPHLPSRRSSALLDCCCSVIRVNRPLQLSPHEIGRLHETGRVWNAVSLSLLLLKNPNYQNLSAKMGQKDKADAVAYPLWMSLNNFRRRTGKKKQNIMQPLLKEVLAMALVVFSGLTAKLLSYDWESHI